uniref:COX assembly mitochondrial protein homolog n=1 Tax=Oncorhynchus gorbuscha TaxID=8017 RepID=UPI001EAF66C8|nr:COX assembly mitochondrial protein homolog [Oncorhynchus gorbuscha]
MEATKAEEPFLRHVETDVLIPKMVREKAKELCAEKVTAFNHCCKETGFLMVFYYRDSAFFEECKQEYIKEKLEFQRTGVAAKNRSQKLPTSM